MDDTHYFPEIKPLAFTVSSFIPKRNSLVEYEGKIFNLIRVAWTNWISCDDYEFKTNYKTIKVRKDGFKAKATCHKDDDFDINEGIKICLERIKEKKRRE